MKRFSFYIYCVFLILLCSGRAEAINSFVPTDNSTPKIEREYNSKSNSYFNKRRDKTAQFMSENTAENQARKIVKINSKNTTVERVPDFSDNEEQSPEKPRESGKNKAVNLLLNVVKNTTADSDKTIFKETERQNSEVEKLDNPKNEIKNNIAKSNIYDENTAEKKSPNETVNETNNKYQKEIKKINKTNDNLVDNSVYKINFFENPKTEELYKDVSLVSEFTKFALMPFILDKMYQGKKINQDIRGFIRYAYPELDDEEVETYNRYMKKGVDLIRKYKTLREVFRHKVKAEKIIPEDAPIVAKDGEYAEEFIEARKKSPYGKYQVSYTPYKYLEYDVGALGEPVRRRDKNYVEERLPVNELMLSLLEFNFKRFFETWNKMPKYHDGSSEKPVEMKSGVMTRILLETARPGDKEKIRGVIEVRVPKNYYINGDYLNRQTHMGFALEEGVKGAKNIKKFELHMPLPFGVDVNQTQKRILTGTFYVPFTLERNDVTAKTVLAGKFGYMLCAHAHVCNAEIGQHEITLKPSEEYESSVYDNAVIQNFAALPQTKTENVSLERVEWDTKREKLYVRFKTNKLFANVSVMAEDGSSRSFLNPIYHIEKDYVTAEFEVKGEIEKTAISAVFDWGDRLRVVAMPTDLAAQRENQKSDKPWWFYVLWGIMLNFMPGGYYLYGRSCRVIKENEKRVIFSYLGGILCGLGIWLMFGILTDFQVYPSEYALLLVGGVFLLTALETECLEYMDFELFRPFAGIMPRGLFFGCAIMVMTMLLPVPYKDVIVRNWEYVSGAERLKMIALIACGCGLLPWVMTLHKDGKNLNLYWLMFKRFCAAYCGLALVWLGWETYAYGGWWSLCWMVLGGCGCFGFWYFYPVALTEAVKYAGTEKRDVRKVVQKHGIAVLMILFGLTVGGVGLGTPSYKITPYQEGYITQKKNSGKPFLIMVEDPHSFISFKNKFAYFLINEIDILRLDVRDENTKLWLKEVQRDFVANATEDNLSRLNKSYHMPISILYVPSYQNGVILPKHLHQIDFKNIRIN